MTYIRVTAFMPAPMDEVFAFFDDPDNALEFNEHAERFEVVDVQPDGRRTIDVLMKAGRKSWTLTIEQLVREPPTRLMTRGRTWTQPDRYVLTATTDRHFSAEGDGTRVDVAFDARPHRPFAAVLKWLQRDAVRRELQHQLALAAERLAARQVRP
jgi:hypothetical protein